MHFLIIGNLAQVHTQFTCVKHQFKQYHNSLDKTFRKFHNSFIPMGVRPNFALCNLDVSKKATALGDVGGENISISLGDAEARVTYTKVIL